MPKLSRPEELAAREEAREKAKEKVYKWISDYQESGDEDAQYELVVHYKNLVESIARKYSQGKSFHEDLVQVGNIGLLGAIRRYDASFGKSFEAFAVPTIVGEIKRFLRDKTWSVHVPRRIKELGPKIKNAVEELTRELQRSPQISDIANFIGATEEEILEAMEMGKSYQALSVDHSIEADTDGSTITLLDVVGGEDDGFERVNQRMLLEKVLPALDEREQKILQYTFIENRSQKETGDLLDISQMHVSRIQRQAIKKLRAALQDEDLE
ncbi:RNA polymerase sigma factor SigB [Listeria booriae]|uniref:RNA polymerase sigma factor n=3 Tax=Listeria TaxID=1637 RepID=A0A099WIS5_9LIST|nr:RNA polymerase sigma factor SigB [Listeria booriae]KGL44581.1 RNA polymerase sigma factor SigB [Listeria booriae]MBC1210429.1 RNA polymerase sigma factor SigB [Listeria booriae]MBC1228092.1 RNA polymerase sigma factor SigB [Listeria booriae]MBC1234317.1 RNA polymerase sigma factor SigB [Listeria booriae]MBC1247687.1 RNA polymerase sigma factor SigB [Listeria booriae]